MPFFKRNKGKDGKKSAGASPSRDSFPQRVGVVSGILTTSATLEGSLPIGGIADHQLTVGSDGLVNANVEAHTVLVLGRVSGDVVASELVEIKAGGVIGGDVKSPRVIMHDGGVVVGGMDLSAALPGSARSSQPEEARPERPRLIRVEPAHDPSRDEGRR
jgi:cytoskeletal protein CcmA (bactofilin family)